MNAFSDKSILVLIMGNEPAINFLLQRFCEQLDFKVTMASYLNFGKERPDLIIYSDIQAMSHYHIDLQRKWKEDILTILCENDAEEIDRGKVDIDLILTQPLSFLAFSKAMDELGVRKLS